MILLVTMIVFMSSNSSIEEGNQLSSEVIAHDTTIRKYADECEIPYFVNALQAIMMQKSGGRGTDPMQASECAYNLKYPNFKNQVILYN